MRLVISHFMSLDGVVQETSGVLCCVYRPGATPAMSSSEG